MTEPLNMGAFKCGGGTFVGDSRLQLIRCLRLFGGLNLDPSRRSY